MDLFAVVTRGRMPKSGKIIVHTYGPYSEIRAKKVRRGMKANARAIGYRIEVNICKLIDPEGESDVIVSASPLAGAEVPTAGEGGASAERRDGGRGAGTRSGAEALLDPGEGQDGSSAFE
jgi:hypothetical protein